MNAKNLALARAIRQSKREQRTPQKVCIGPACFQGDHIGGRNHIPHIIVELCELDHVLLTEQRMDAGADMRKQPTVAKMVVMALRSISVTLDAVKATIGKCAEALRWLADQLENECNK